MTALYVTTKVEVTRKQLDDLLITAIEGGVGYWCSVARIRTASYSGRPWYATTFSDGAGLMVYPAEPDGVFPDDKPVKLTLARAVQGLELLAEHHPSRWSEFITEQYDVETADVWMQLAVLGEVVYG